MKETDNPNKHCHVIKCTCNTGLPKAECLLFSDKPCRTKEDYVSDYINWNKVRKEANP